MTATADVLTPIHKSIRSMIYSLGAKMQRLDFADRESTDRLLAEIEIDFGSALGENCILCLVHAHAGGEEWAAFPAAAKVEPVLIESLLAEHRALTERLRGISGRASEMRTLTDPAARVAAGAQLNREVNRFFGEYIAHMNREEDELVPAMQRHFTDAEIYAMRTATERHMPRERLAAYLRWMLPSLNATELTAILRGAKRDAPPEAYQFLIGLAEETVDPERWKVVQHRIPAEVNDLGRGPAGP